VVTGIGSLSAWCHTLVLEINESRRMAPLTVALDPPIRLSLKGAPRAMDDVSAGYANPGRIKRALWRVQN